MKKTIATLFVLVLIGSLIPHQASAARGGGGRAAGGGGANFSGGGAHFNGGGGAARQSFGHAPTFSVTRSSSPVIRETPPHEIVGRTPTGLPEGRTNFERSNSVARPNLDRRPGVENRPDFTANHDLADHRNPFDRAGGISRPDFGNRGEFVNHTGIATRPTIENRARVDFDHNTLNRTTNISRTAAYGNWYHGDWHDHWDHHWNHRPVTWWGPNWWGAGYYPGVAALYAPWNWGYWNYTNPYYTAPAVAGEAVIDYAQPLALAGGSVEPPQTAQDQAMQIFNTARDSFQRGDYPLALTQINQGLGLMPSDPVLNEFRGLVLFSLKQYPDAAATVYAVLSAGPGWDWTTLSNLYPDTDVYTEQLRALEQYVRSHPQEGDTRFLLGYHYLTCGYSSQAATQFAAAVQLNPKDQLSAQLLASLQEPNSTGAGATGAVATGQPPTALPTGAEFAPALAEQAPITPVTADDIAGAWKSARPDGGNISLSLGKDSKYDWRYTANGKTQDFNGTYQLADNLLILRQGNNPTMVGQVTPMGNSGFNFKLAGDNSSDPGLTFTR